MLNYAILLIPLIAFSIFVIAWSLAASLGDAFRDLPVARPGPADDDPDSLTYARKRPKPDAIRNHPWIAVVIAVLRTILTAALLLGWPFLLGPIGFPRSPMIPAAIGLLLVLTGFVILSRRALRRCADGIPAAAHWPRQRLRKYAFLFLLAAVPLYGVLSLRTSAMLSARLQEADEVSAGLQVRDVSPDATSKCRRLLDVIISGRQADYPTWNIGWHETGPDIPTGPPAFPPELANIVDATYCLAAYADSHPDLGTSPVNRTVLSPTPYGYARPVIMHLHAADALAHGDTATATRDLTALHALAALEATSANTAADVVVATATDRTACDITQMLLPFVRTSQELEPLSRLPGGWHRPTLLRALCGEHAMLQRSIISALNSRLAIELPGLLKLITSQPYRVLLGEAELHQLDAEVPQPSTQAVASLPDAIRWGRSLPGWGGPYNYYADSWPGGYTTILAPPTHRIVRRVVETESLRQLQQLGIAATLYRLQTGRLPTTLDEIPGISPDLLTDPYTGQRILLSIRDHEIILHLQSVSPAQQSGAVHFRIADTPLWDLPLPREFQPTPVRK